MASDGENFPSWLTTPIKRLSSEKFVGGFSSRITNVFSGSAFMPFPSITCPRNLTLLHVNSHFSGLSVAPAFFLNSF